MRLNFNKKFFKKNRMADEDTTEGPHSQPQARRSPPVATNRTSGLISQSTPIAIQPQQQLVRRQGWNDAFLIWDGGQERSADAVAAAKAQDSGQNTTQPASKSYEYGAPGFYDDNNDYKLQVAETAQRERRALPARYRSRRVKQETRVDTPRAESPRAEFPLVESRDSWFYRQGAPETRRQRALLEFAAGEERRKELHRQYFAAQERAYVPYRETFGHRELPAVGSSPEEIARFEASRRTNVVDQAQLARQRKQTVPNLVFNGTSALTVADHTLPESLRIGCPNVIKRTPAQEFRLEQYHSFKARVRRFTLANPNSGFILHRADTSALVPFAPRPAYSSKKTENSEVARRYSNGERFYAPPDTCEKLEEVAASLSVMSGPLEDNMKPLEEKRNFMRLGSLGTSSAFNDMTFDVGDTSNVNSEKAQPTQQPSSQLASPILFQSPKEIVDAAKRGPYSPAAAQALSLVTRARADSRSSKTSAYGTRKEPILEGQPLAEFTTTTDLSRQNSTYSHFSSRNISRAPSIAEVQEENALGRRPLAVRNPSNDEGEDGSSFLDKNKMGCVSSRAFTAETADLGGQPLRPVTAETAAEVELQQNQALFEDFDGQHIETAPPSPPPPPPPGLDKRQSTATLLSPLTPSFDRPKTYYDPVTGLQMVFYPAPVPEVLELPQKLSNRPNANERAKRHTQVLSTAPAVQRPQLNTRTSALWLPEVDIADDGKRKTFMDEDFSTPSLLFPKTGATDSVMGKRATEDMSLLPDQLRANEYFEQVAPTRVMQIQQQSAVTTLDKFLDESAYAPVHAFTDHEIVGRLGAGVYAPEEAKRKSHGGTQLFGSDKENLKPEKRKSSFFGLVGGNRSDDGDVGRRSTLGILRTKSPAYKGVDNETSPESSDSEESDSEQHQHAMPEDDTGRYHGAPTTLLAELTLRKQQAKERTRPSATQSGVGYRSTLLEMDSVAQREKKKRENRPVTLAWQDKAVVDELREQDDEDDDVPLGMLFPERARKQMRDADRPMGLMEARELEDNEPLSKRRERLLANKPIRRPELMTRHSMMSLGLGNGNIKHNSADTITPGASVSQTNLARPRSGVTLSDGKRDSALLPPTRPVSGAFSAELMRSLGATPEPNLDIDEDNETLAQRRDRLKAEKEAREREVGVLGNRSSAPNLEKDLARPQLKQRRSMADVLQAHPAKVGVVKRPTSQERLSKLRPTSIKHSRHPSAEFPHLVEHEREQQRQKSQMQKAQVLVRQQAEGIKVGHYSGNGSNYFGSSGMPTPLVHGASNYGMGNYQAQQGLTTGFPTLLQPSGQAISPFGAGAGSYFTQQPMMMGGGMGMYPQQQQMQQTQQMQQLQMQVRAQQQAQMAGQYGGMGQQQQMGGGFFVTPQQQAAQWAHWQKFQGPGAMGGGGGGVMNGPQGQGYVDAWRKNIM